MMFQPCPACGQPDSVMDDGPFKETCTCDACDAQFHIEADADHDGDGYVDTSTVGEQIN